MLKWSVFVYVVGVMLALIHLHFTHRRMLNELQTSVNECSNFHCYYFCCSGKSLALECRSNREKRDLSSRRRIKRQNERDTTVLSWGVGRNRGTGLQVSGVSIIVVNDGLYFIYSQVLYKDPTCVMGHVITKRLKGSETILMKCLKSMPNNTLTLNTCYTAGVHFLESGSVLELSVPRRMAELVISAHATFMGIFSI